MSPIVVQLRFRCAPDAPEAWRLRWRDLRDLMRYGHGSREVFLREWCGAAGSAADLVPGLVGRASDNDADGDIVCRVVVDRRRVVTPLVHGFCTAANVFVGGECIAGWVKE